MRLASIANPPLGLYAADQPLINELHREAHAMFKALKVIQRDPKIRTWLACHDFKALEQVDSALS